MAICTHQVTTGREAIFERYSELIRMRNEMSRPRYEILFKLSVFKFNSDCNCHQVADQYFKISSP